MRDYFHDVYLAQAAVVRAAFRCPCYRRAAVRTFRSDDEPSPDCTGTLPEGMPGEEGIEGLELRTSAHRSNSRTFRLAGMLEAEEELQAK